MRGIELLILRFRSIVNLQSNQALRGKGIFTKSPKNETSVRKVALSENMLTQLERQCGYFFANNFNKKPN